MNAYLFRNYKKYVVPETNTQGGVDDENGTLALNIKDFIKTAKKD